MLVCGDLFARHKPLFRASSLSVTLILRDHHKLLFQWTPCWVCPLIDAISVNLHSTWGRFIVPHCTAHPQVLQMYEADDPQLPTGPRHMLLDAAVGLFDVSGFSKIADRLEKEEADGGSTVRMWCVRPLRQTPVGATGKRQIFCACCVGWRTLTRPQRNNFISYSCVETGRLFVEGSTPAK